MPGRFRRAVCLVAVGVALSGSVAVLAQSAPKQPAYKPNQQVQVREGDEWSPATIVKREGRKYQIRYDDGTEEWVTTDRLRSGPAAGPAGGKARAPRAGAPAGKAPAKAGAAPRRDPPAGDDGKAGEKKEVFRTGSKVEVKSASTWKPASIKNRSGDLYLVVFDGWDHQMHWQWVHVSAVRNIGSDKAGPKWGKGVGIGGKTIEAAREEARQEFADIEQELADEAAGVAKDPFAPAPYDKEIAEANVDGAAEFTAADAPPKLAAFDAAPAGAKAARNLITLKSPAANGATTSLLLSGARAVVADVRQGGKEYTASIEPLDLAAGKSLGRVEPDRKSRPVSLSPSGGRLLGIQYGFHSNTKIRIDLHAIKPGAALEHVISFIPYAGESGQKDVAFAAFAGGDDDVMTYSAAGVLIVWDAPKATALWRTAGQANVPPAVSPGGKQVAVLTEAGLAVHDAVSGEPLCLVPGGGTVTSLAFTPDGRRVIGGNGRVVSCWDLARGERLPDIGLPAPDGATAGAVTPSLHPLDGRFVLVGASQLLDLDRKLVVWTYQQAGRPVVAVAPGGRCWSVSTEGERRTVASAVLPHPAARKAAEAIQPGQGLMLGPGGRVALNVTVEGTPEQRQRVEAALNAQLAQAGIVVDANSPLRLVARTEFGKTHTRTYQVHRFGPGGGGGNETVTVTEKITRLGFEHAGKPVWEHVTTTGYLPMMVSTKPNQTIAQAVAEQNKYDPTFLERVRLPAFLPAPSDAPWAGSSRWSAKGIVDERAPLAPPAGIQPPAPVGDGLE